MFHADFSFKMSDFTLILAFILWQFKPFIISKELHPGNNILEINLSGFPFYKLSGKNPQRRTP